MKRISALVCMILIAAAMCMPACFAADNDKAAEVKTDLEITQTSPENGTEGVAVDNFSVKIYFNKAVKPETKEAKKLDYLIFGCHYEGSDETGRYFGRAKTVEDLVRYTDSAVKGIETGLFAYMAHPDLFMRGYPVFDENCRAAAKDICQCCKQNNLPMEINLHDRYRLGGMNGNGYPNADFFEIVYETGNQVIIGLDAHEPQEIENPKEYDWACGEFARFGERLLRSLDLG